MKTYRNPKNNKHSFKTLSGTLSWINTMHKLMDVSCSVPAFSISMHVSYLGNSAWFQEFNKLISRVVDF